MLGEIEIAKEVGKSIPAFVEINFNIDYNNRLHLDIIRKAHNAYTYFLLAQDARTETEEELENAFGLLRNAISYDNQANFMMENIGKFASKDFALSYLMDSKEHKANGSYITYALTEYGCATTAFEWLKGNALSVADSIAEFLLLKAQSSLPEEVIEKYADAGWRKSA